MKINYRHILQRTQQMLLHPASEWTGVLRENVTYNELLRRYLLPIVTAVSVIVCLLRMLQYSPLQAVILGIIHFLASIGGLWITYRIVREYLCGKLNYPEYEAVNLSVYSHIILIIFSGIGHALGNSFIGDIFTLTGFIFLRTLYTGIGQWQDLPANHRTNLLLITALSMIFIPIAITHILTAVFQIPETHI